MKVLVVGCGLVGRALASSLRAGGHAVVGTTTSQAKVDGLRDVCDDVFVLRGSDAGAVADAARGVDVAVVCAGPDARRAMSADERAATYRDVLVGTAEGVVAGVRRAGVRGPVVALSSLSVHGDAADHLPEVTEDSPLTASADASPRCFQEMERTYSEGLGEQAVVFRCADIYGDADPPIEAKVRLAHEVLGGSVPFSGEALYYRVHVDDVVRAVGHALETPLSGVFNLTHREVPPSNRDVFDGIGHRLGLPPLWFRGELVAPSVPVSTERLASTGFRLERTTVQTS